MKVLKVGTDFSGIGSPEEALRELKNEGFLDFESEFACEIDKYARLSHKELHHSKVMYEDITKRNHSEVPQLDLYVAGFPCQAFSIAGKQLGFEDVRGTLFFNVADFIRENQPKTFVLENVKGLLSHDNGRTFQTIIDLLSNGGGTVNGQMALDFFGDGLGYHIHYKVLNTKEHGIPQNRERIFIVGFKESRDYSFPVKEPLKLRLKDLLQDSTSDKYYLSDKAINGIFNSDFNSKQTIIQDEEKYCATLLSRDYKDPKCVKVKPIKVDEKYYLSDKVVESLLVYNERQVKNGTGFSAKFRDVETTEVMDAIKIGGAGKDDLIKVKSNTKKGFEEAKEGDSINYSIPTSKTRRGRVGKQVAQTLDTSCSQGVVESKSIRRLTPLECWRLQGFSDESFYKAEKVNSDTQLYKQAGNSITVDVIKKIIYNIYK